MSENRNFPGSQWFKFDFHTHTPASKDYDEQCIDITPVKWLQCAMESKLDCVAVTDHNSGEWIDVLKAKNDELRISNNKPDWYKELTIFPGVEITVSDSRSRVHLLAVFDPKESGQTVTSVLGGCGITSGFGDTETSTTKSFIDTVGQISSAGGIAIPAHIDGCKGLLENASSLTLELENSLKTVFAAEFCDLQNFADEMDKKLIMAVARLAKLGGSDAHSPTKIGQYYSWIKMSKPTIEGLKLALGDHDFCVKNQTEDPNRYPEVFLSELTIKNMKHCGRIKDEPFKIKLHPQFNTIIGGRGTGKSTILESIRIVSRYDQNLDSEVPKVKEDLDKFMQLSRNNGVMLDDTEILLERHRRGKKYKLRWKQNGEGVLLERETQGGWQEFEVGDLKDRYPISIFSQRQINELASNPQGLLGLIDRSPNVDRSSWDSKWKSAKSKFMQLNEKKRELKQQLSEEQPIKGRMADLEYDLKHYEEQGHGDVLKEYQKKKQQINGMAVGPVIKEIEDRIRELASQTELSDFPMHLFDAQDETTTEMENIHMETAQGLRKIVESLNQLAEEVNQLGAKRGKQISKSKFYESYKNSEAAYNRLVEEYETRDNQFSISQYGEWVQQRNQFQVQLKNLESVRKELKFTEEQIKEFQGEFKNLRDELFRKRKEFLDSIIGENAYVRMELVQYGDVSTLERDYRSLLNLTSDIFQTSIFDKDNSQGILFKLGMWEDNNLSEEEIEQLIVKLKNNTIEIANGKENANDRRFATRLMKLFAEQPVIFDNIGAWWPEDMLRVKYSQNSSKNKFEILDKGSAGQKAAAILAFLLNYGNEPLIIDQPEDDLDSALIYDLIVKEIRESKNYRQVIIATHNPNLVVNGDSELVSVMKFQNGQVQIDKQGGLEESNIRIAICDIMEGGRQAFEKRYKRITLEV